MCIVLLYCGGQLLRCCGVCRGVVGEWACVALLQLAVVAFSLYVSSRVLECPRVVSRRLGRCKVHCSAVQVDVQAPSVMNCEYCRVAEGVCTILKQS